MIMPENIHDIDKAAKEFQKRIYEFLLKTMEHTTTVKKEN